MDRRTIQVQGGGGKHKDSLVSICCHKNDIRRIEDIQ